MLKLTQMFSVMIRISVVDNTVDFPKYVFLLIVSIQWVPQLFERQEFFYANKSCKIERCGSNLHQIVQNMILSQGLELKLSLL